MTFAADPSPSTPPVPCEPTGTVEGTPPTPVRIGVLAVQGDVREHLEALRACGADAVPVRRAEELDDVEGLVLPGGESTTIDRLLRAFGLAEPVRSRLAAGMPAYGSCAGMILLADRLVHAHAGQQTLGGLDVLVRRNAFGRQVDSFEADLHLDAAALERAVGAPEDAGVDAVGREPVRAVFIRAPWVEEVGADVEVLATVEVDGVPRPVAVRQGNLLATSFHPEVTGDRRVHALFVRMVQRARSAA